MTRLRERFPKHNFVIVEDALAEAMQQQQLQSNCTEAERAMLTLRRWQKRRSVILLHYPLHQRIQGLRSLLT